MNVETDGLPFLGTLYRTAQHDSRNPLAPLVPYATILIVTHDTRIAVVAAVEDDVPDDGLWMGGRMTGTMDGKKWE